MGQLTYKNLQKEIKNKKYNYEDILDLLKFIYQSNETLSSHEEVVKTWFNNRDKDDKKKVQERKK